MVMPRGTQHINKIPIMKELGSCSNTYIMGLENYFYNGFNEAIEVLVTGDLTEGEISKATEPKRKKLESLGYEVSLGFEFRIKNNQGLERFTDLGYYIKIKKISKIKRFLKGID